MLALALALSRQPDVSPVYRCAFEERSRMVLIKMSPTRWMAFNPKTCAIQKIWEGDVDWRGKVYDFSQNTSRAKGKVLFELPSELESLTSLWPPRLQSTGPTTWEAEGAKLENGVTTFQSDSGYVLSAHLYTKGFSNIYVAFDESSRSAPFRVEVLDISGKEVGDWFYSTTHGGSDTDFQWNYKQIWPGATISRIKFTSTKATAKKLRNVRIIGDYEMFTGDKPVDVIWKGYEVGRGAVHLNFEIKTGDKSITASMTPGDEIVMKFSGDLSAAKLRLPSQNERVVVVGAEAAEEYPLVPEMRLRLKEGI